jgi:hypothetical protein
LECGRPAPWQAAIAESRASGVLGTAPTGGLAG